MQKTAPYHACWGWTVFPLGAWELLASTLISSSKVETLTQEFADVFNGDLGKYTGTPISFNLDPQVEPICLKPHRGPFALRSKVDKQLDKLIAQGVLEPFDYAKWETPIEMPVKPDSSVTGEIQLVLTGSPKVNCLGQW